MHSRRSSSCVLAVVLVGLLSATSLLPAEPAEERTRPTGPPLEHAEDLVAVTVAGLESGGLIVCLDGEDGALAAAVSRGGKFLVQVLCSDAGRVAAVRKAIALHGLDGRVSAEHGSLKRLPYASSLVNVVVVEDFARALSRGLSVKEIMRVLAPRGVACLGAGAGGDQSAFPKQVEAALAEAGIREKVEMVHRGGYWARIVKPRPAEMDEWTHFRHDPTGSAVSRDTLVSWPTHIRWIADPPYAYQKWGVNMGMASAGGWNFYVLYNARREERGRGSTAYLIARDAFNGLLLWQQPVDPKSQRDCLVTDGEQIFAVRDEALCSYRCSDGKLLRKYPEISRPESVLRVGADTIVVLHSRGSELCALEIDTGKTRWQYKPAGGKRCAVPRAAGEGVYFLEGELATLGWGFFGPQGKDAGDFVALDVHTGRPRWRSPASQWSGGGELVLDSTDGEVLAVAEYDGKAHMGATHGISAVDGKHLWTHRYRFGGPHIDRPWHNHFFIGGLLWVDTDPNIQWSGENMNAPKDAAWVGLDPKTGDLKRRIPHVSVKHRCQPDFATVRYCLWGSHDLLDWQTGEHRQFGYYRVGCHLGSMPANGLLYVPTNGCRCYALVRGALALASEESEPPDAGGERFLRGPAFGEVDASAAAGDADWPTYRHDAARSGSTPADVPAEVAPSWTAALGGRLTAPVVAGGSVYVARVDAAELVCLDAASGQARWRFTAGGRIDSPPTIYRGLCLFGGRDGWVYCLRAADGVEVWRFRAAPAERRIVAAERLESPWPVFGSVLVQGGVAYFAAGRASSLPEGVFVYAVDPLSGKVLWEKRSTGPGINDVLVGGVNDAKTVYMSVRAFDAATGRDRLLGMPYGDRASRGGWFEYFQPRRGKVPDCYLLAGAGGRGFGLLDGTMFIRTCWWTDGKAAGQMLVFRDGRTWGVRCYPPAETPTISVKRIPYELSAWRTDDDRPGEDDTEWSAKSIPVAVRAMVLAGGALFVAGPPDRLDPKGGLLWAYSAADGKKLAELRLDAPPVWDGMAAAGGRLYVSAENGILVCLTPRSSR